jgi:hypothetical protein
MDEDMARFRINVNAFILRGGLEWAEVIEMACEN